MRICLSNFIYQWIGNFAMPEHIINYNNPTNPHLQY